MDEGFAVAESLFWKKLLIRSGIAKFLPSVRRRLAGGERFLRYYSDRVLNAPLEELLDDALFPDVQAPDAINLALGAPRCDLPLGALRGVNDRRALSVWGIPELRQEIAEQYKLDHGPAVDPADEVLVTHGAAGAFTVALDTFVNPKARVVLFDPTSPIYRIGLKHRRATIVWVPTWVEDGNVRLAMDAFGKAMRGARMLVLCDPVNPTGAVFAGEDLEQIAFWAKKFDVLVYQDESFGRYRYDDDGIRLAGLPHAENRVITAGSVSKTFGLSAARIGWLAGCKHLIRPCAVTAALNAPFVSPLCQQLALTALRSGDARAAALRDEFAGRRRYVFERLQSVGLEPALPAGAFFFWVPVEPLGLSGREFARQLLAAKRVLVNPGEPFGPSGRYYVRLSYAAEDGRLREGLSRLIGFVSELRSKHPQLNKKNGPQMDTDFVAQMSADQPDQSAV
jgi:aspartate/methionine/tyrosine aminotransferase